MPRVVLPVTQITDAGVAPPAQQNGDAANNHEVHDNEGNTFIEVTNADGAAPHTITVVTPAKVEGLDVADVVLPVPASAVRLLGPFDTGVFNQHGTGDHGKVFVNVDSAQLKLRAYSL